VEDGCQVRRPLRCAVTFVRELRQFDPAVGDACSKDGDAACSPDGKSVVECKNGKFEATQSCDGKCVASGLFVKCE
jgi:hypothetical protein